MTDAQLERLSLKELRDLNVEIENAIRAAIRAKNAARDAALQPASAQKAAAPPVIDLEKERDMWLTARGAKQPV